MTSYFLAESSDSVWKLARKSESDCKKSTDDGHRIASVFNKSCAISSDIERYCCQNATAEFHQFESFFADIVEKNYKYTKSRLTKKLSEMCQSALVTGKFGFNLEQQCLKTNVTPSNSIYGRISMLHGEDKLNQSVVLKRFEQNKHKEWNSVELMDEFLLLNNFYHPNIASCRFLSWSYSSSNGISLTLCQDDYGIDFDGIIRSTMAANEKLNNFWRCDLNEKRLFKIMVQTAKGVNYLHNKKLVAHRDLKPDNLFCSISYGEIKTIKIGDFGLSCQLTQKGMKKNKSVGTVTYMAPEIFYSDNSIFGKKWVNYGNSSYENKYDPMKADMWSFAATFLRSTQENHLYDDDCKKEAFELRFPYDTTDYFSNLCVELRAKSETLEEKAVVDVLEGCLTYNPELRYTISDICIKLGIATA